MDLEWRIICHEAVTSVGQRLISQHNLGEEKVAPGHPATLQLWEQHIFIKSIQQKVKIILKKLVILPSHLSTKQTHSVLQTVQVSCFKSQTLWTIQSLSCVFPHSSVFQDGMVNLILFLGQKGHSFQIKNSLFPI